MLFATNGTFMYVLGQVLDDAHLHSLATSSRTSSADSEYYEDDAEAEYISAEGQWVAEPVLWTHWFHVGDLVAVSECQVIHLDSRVFGETVRCNGRMWQAMRGYAHEFLGMLNKVNKEKLTDLSDEMFPARDVLEQSKFAERYGRTRVTTHPESTESMTMSEYNRAWGATPWYVSVKCRLLSTLSFGKLWRKDMRASRESG
jgi:hypothetical protein